MATFKHNEVETYSAAAAADLTGKLDYLAKIDSNGEIAVCGDGEVAIGTITEENTQGNQATVHSGFILKVIAGASFNPGDKVASNASGQAVLATTGEFAIGVALEAGAANRKVAVMAIHCGRVA